MAEYTETLKYALNKMEEYYLEYGNKKDMKYAYGYFDAIAVIRNMLSEPPLSDRKRHDDLV